MEEEKTAVLPEETVPEGAQGETAPAAAEEGGDPAFLAASAEEFFRRYPQVDIVRLERDPAFRRFCGSRLYREPLADLYGDYLAVAEETRAPGRRPPGGPARAPPGPAPAAPPVA